MNRILQLDGIRGIAVIWVLLFHLLNNSYINTDINSLNQLEILIMKLTSFGWAGVNLFFILSGFLIGSILLNKRQSNGYFKIFYLRRFSRIIPIYFILIGLYYLLEQHFEGIKTVLFEKPISLTYYFLFLQNFIMSYNGHFGPNALTPTWSLAVEEQFYLIIPFVIYFFNDKKVLFFCIFIIIFSPIYRSLSLNWYQEYTHILSRMDAPCYGVLLALFYKNQEWFNFLKKHKWAFLFLFAIIIFLFKVENFKFLNHSIISILFFAFVTFTLFLKTNSRLFNLLTNKYLIKVGQLSYFIYLFHQIINGTFFLIFDYNRNPNLVGYQSYIIECCALIVTIVLAELSYRFIESKFIKFSHQF